MKRFTAILCVILMLLAMTGCGCKHEWAEATCTTPETCVKCGATQGEAKGHEWQEATCTKPETCAACGETQGEAKGHDAAWAVADTNIIKATRTMKLTCAVCGEVLETKEEDIETFIDNKVFLFTAPEFVERFQNAWDVQAADRFQLKMKYSVNSMGYINFDIYNSKDAWLGWGIFYDESGNAIEASNADAPIGSIRIIIGPIDGLEVETIFYLFTSLLGPCSCAIDPSIKDSEMYKDPISQNNYSISDGKALNGLHYTCGYDKDGGKFILDIDIA